MSLAQEKAAARAESGHRPIEPLIDLPPGIPDAPPELTGHAVVEWSRLTRELSDAGVLTRVDRGVLSVYCRAWARILESEANIAEQGEVIEVKGIPTVNPWSRIRDRAAQDIITTSKELGFTPGARSRIKIKEKKAVNKLAAFNSRKNQNPVGRIG